MQNPNAKLHKELGYRDVTTSGLQVMDETAITLCKENDIPVRQDISKFDRDSDELAHHAL